ncbi:hypothetical protein VF_A0773 [Aliivibrio fischeri ES114]|uniref:Uncharacterized protein n=3 Tax=Aliivibrio fischeri TaxID=668 RepID=Q5DZF3_ALIF1|nr:hypothetical protein VF_A0773 [Aliivibrio fischeri ES114]MUH95933.1 hypothetical protein [Aliivibrio fischeri]MUI62788.1 hypothetical protein [Aliivibrio fischeri]MUJ22130.1 hypothetical protein [Aliivibrio fischeri]MUJ23965.1 hypothetical protein [Aliivibrio fischeri]
MGIFMNHQESVKIELNSLSIQQLRNLQSMVSQKLKEKTADSERVDNAILTDEELDMLALVMKN